MESQELLSTNPISKRTIMDKQSVRTTFRLGDAALRFLASLRRDLGLKPKELFEFLCSENEVLAEVAAAYSRERSISGGERRPYVISRGTLQFLNERSKQLGVPRDAFLEGLILAFKRVLEVSEEKERENVKTALAMISELSQKAEEIEEQLKKMFDKGHPLLDRLGTVIVVISNLCSALEGYLETGEPIDPDAF